MVAQAVAPDRPDLRIQTEFRGAVARLFDEAEGEIVISGPAGTGKTRSILELIHLRCSQERVRVLMLRKTLESLKTSAMVTFQEQVLYGFDGKRSAADGVTYFGGNTIRPAEFSYDRTGSKIIMGGLDNIAKVLSTEYDIIYFNECTEGSLAEWEQITGRTDRPRLGKQRPPSLVIGDCNPDVPTHWILKRAAEQKLTLWFSYHEDNPAMWDRVRKTWTDAGKRYLARLDKLTGVRYQRLRLGKWVAAEGQVYEQWNPRVHLISDDTLATRGVWADLAFHRISAKDIVCGVDWGWTNPGVMQVWAQDHDGRLYLIHEVYQTEKLIGWWADKGKELRDAYGVTTFVCDPSEPAYINQLNAAGLSAVPGFNPIKPGIEAVQARLAVQADGRPRLQVREGALERRDPKRAEAGRTCSTVDEIGSYVWAKRKDGTTKDEPAEGDDHGLDTLRYVVAYVDGLGTEPVGETRQHSYLDDGQDDDDADWGGR